MKGQLTKMDKIGYMGIPGSFSEIAAEELVKIQELSNVTYVPLVCAQNILRELRAKTIDYGVLAVRNSTAGDVTEFVEAFSNVNYEVRKEYVLPIHHCLFKSSADIRMADLRQVASHPQALSQTKETRAKQYPTLVDQPIEDTAIGAEWLAKGELPETTAVICSKKAGTSWGLDLIAENIEDSDENRTTFWLLQLK